MIYDIILISLILLSVIMGFLRGASKTLLSFAAILLSAVIAITASKPLSEFVFEAFVRGSVESEISSSITSTVTDDDNSSDFNNPVSGMYVSAMDYFGHNDEKVEKSCEEIISQKGDEAASGITDIYKPVIKGFISVVISIILFIVLSIVLSFIAKRLSVIFRLPFVHLADKTAGAVIGLLRGVLGVVALAFILKLLAPVIPADTFLIGRESVEQSAVFSYIYNGGISSAVQSFIYRF